jgi:hypothetical protein
MTIFQDELLNQFEQTHVFKKNKLLKNITTLHLRTLTAFNYDNQ